MDPFSILCKSCGARLKVTESSYVGKILACPKCRARIEVIPPDGWTAPDAEAETSSSSSSSGEFEDIDQILADPEPSKVPHSAKSHKASLPINRPSKTHSRRSPQTTPDVQAMDGPVLPNDQWTSDETRKRKRIVTTIAALLGGLLLTFVIVAAILFNLSKPDDTIAENDDSTNQIAAQGMDAKIISPEINEVPVEKLSQVDAPIENPPIMPAETESEISVVSSTPSNVETEPSLIGETASKISKPNHLPPDDNNTNPPVNATVQSPFSSPSPIDPGPLDITPKAPDRSMDVGMVESFEKELGDLSSLLEQGGTSMLEIKDLTASIRNTQFAGLPKYVIAQPEAMNLDLQQQVSMPIGGLKYESAPLTQITRDLFAITGVPITIDSRSIVAAGKDPNPIISVKVSDTNLKEALDQLLSPLGINHTLHSTGVKIEVIPSQEMTTATFGLPITSELDQAESQRVLAAIQNLIEPDSWVRENNPATIELVGNQLVVGCSEDIRHQIGNLLAKLQAALTLVDNPDHPQARAITQSRWDSMAGNLANNPGLSHSVQMDIGSFLNKVQAKTGVTVLVDWEHVITEGWTPLTNVPGNIREETVQNTVAELARTMNLALIATDRNTLVLTSFQHMAQMIDIEVYPLGKLLAGKLKGHQLSQLVTEALGAQLRSERVQFLFEPDCQCLIVSAPQTIQRQIEALLNRLGGI